MLGLLAVAFSNVRNLQPGTAFFPALSISHGERSELNFGSQPFRYPVEGYQPIQVTILQTSLLARCTWPCVVMSTSPPVPAPALQSCMRMLWTYPLTRLEETKVACLQDPPLGVQQEAAQYLLTAFRRLVRLSAPSSEQAQQTAEVFAPPSAAANAASATIDDIDMLVDGTHAYAAEKDTDAEPRRLLSADDAVLLAAALARHLGPLMEDSYLVSRYVLPMLEV